MIKRMLLTLVALLAFITMFAPLAEAQVQVYFDGLNADNAWAMMRAKITVEGFVEGRWKTLYVSVPCTYDQVQSGRDGCISLDASAWISQDKTGIDATQLRVMVSIPGYDKYRADVQYGTAWVYLQKQLLYADTWTYVDDRGNLVSGYYLANNTPAAVTFHYKSSFQSEGWNVDIVDGKGFEGVARLRAGQYTYWQEVRPVQGWMTSLAEGAKFCSALVTDIPNFPAYAYGKAEGCLQGSLTVPPTSTPSAVRK